jgi:mono/diheme cytochrome c family protein
MKPRRRGHYGVFVLSLSTFIALGTYAAIAHCDDSAADNHDHLHHHHFAEFAKVPEKARAQRNPFETDPSAVAAGKKLFEQHCAECHGTTAEGGRKAPNLRAEEVQQATPGTLFWILTNGVVRRGMPVWSKLPEPQRWQIITFLKSLPPSTGPKVEGVHSQATSTPDATLHDDHPRQQ